MIKNNIFQPKIWEPVPRSGDLLLPWIEVMSLMKLKAIIHDAEEGGFWAEVPALPGCVTQGESLAELKANLHEAIEGWLLAAEDDEIGSGEQVLEVAV